MDAESETKYQTLGKRTASNDDSDEIVAIKKPKLGNVFENQKRRQTSNELKHVAPIEEAAATTTTTTSGIKHVAAQSPKKRLQLPDNERKKEKFIYGNYSQYYGYRSKDFKDVRLEVFATRRELFEGKDVLDVGCNNGFITVAVAQRFNVKSIVGIDIDRTLINLAVKNLTKAKKAFPMENEARRDGKYPYNVHYVHGNYVLKDDVLLEIERPQFDLILCLSITKWVQLNFGDAGLKQTFKRIFLQLRSGGKLILEAQPINNYRKRKYVSDEARLNFKEMKLFPEQFTEYLLSKEIGFKSMELLGVPENCAEGFKRPIQVFLKE